MEDAGEIAKFKNGSRYIVHFDFGDFELSTVIEKAGLLPNEVKNMAEEKLIAELSLLCGGSDFSHITCIAEVLE